MGPRAGGQGLIDLATDLPGKTDVRHRTDIRIGGQRVAELVALDDRYRLVDEGFIEALVHIDALDPTAALA